MALRATSALQKSGKASGAWLSRQARDPYVKCRAEHPANFRSRSAFKLLEIHEKHGVLGDSWVKNIVDLGAAPGGWSQAAANYFGFLENTYPGHDPASLDMQTSEQDSPMRVPVSDTNIVALDLLPIAPINGVHTIQADFLSPTATSQIASVLLKTGQEHPAPVDVLLSDMSANHTGNRAADVENALDLAKAVFHFAGGHLAPNTGTKRHPGGTLVMKYFKHPLLDAFQKRVLQPSFRQVLVVKPKASRMDSAECYWSCKGFKGNCVPDDVIHNL